MNFSKNPKKSFGANLGSFCANLGKNEFSWKKRFKHSNYLPSCQKSEKTNELMDGQADRQQ